ncbi:hypothetical protein [Phytoactinopolyspora mesophila]|uniref:DUF86 domain-containing protein n=1 Tax=Phytoactinopolyspora mesophila TaxID=2650750 RepID=A0A7K3M4F4_9ACTN|nr:hypothetical protein [Phytoactinopolyspora mesophila]NDL57917.1 hypothetical protein [Phytoactinopolyspora mesophila]
MSGKELRPDRHALLELDALLDQIARRRDAGNRTRYDTDADYRWVLHRLWIAVGNEAHAYTEAAGLHPLKVQPWGTLYRLRNVIAHTRLPDIDEDHVWRMTVMRLDSLRDTVRKHLN